jgi:hypothetical protein
MAIITIIVTLACGIVILNMPTTSKVITKEDENYNMQDSLPLGLEIAFNALWGNDTEEYVFLPSGVYRYNSQVWNGTLYDDYVVEKKGYYKTVDGELILNETNVTVMLDKFQVPVCQIDGDISFNYNFSSNNTILTLIEQDNRSIQTYSQQLKIVQTLEEIEKYQGQKVIITGNLTNITDNTKGSLFIDSSNIRIQVSFENYTNNNLSDFKGKYVEITGNIYKSDVNSTDYEAFMRDVESIIISEA